MEKVIKFKLEKETKNTYRFEEITEGEPFVVKTLYIQKWFLKNKPNKIEIILKVGDER